MIPIVVQQYGLLTRKLRESFHRLRLNFPREVGRSGTRVFSHCAHGDSVSFYYPAETEQHEVWVLRIKEFRIECVILDLDLAFPGHYCPFVKKGPAMDPGPSAVFRK